MKFIGTLPLTLSNSKGLYIIRLPEQSGGKAGKGKNVTSHIQVMYQGLLAVRQMRYIVADYKSKTEAIKKAIAFVIGDQESEKYFK